MKPNVIAIVKIGVSIASMALSVVGSIIAKKEMDATIAAKVAEAIADSTKAGS